MFRSLRKIRALVYCCLISILVHVAFACATRFLGRSDFGAAVREPGAVMVDLTGKPAPAAAGPPEGGDAPDESATPSEEPQPHEVAVSGEPAGRQPPLSDSATTGPPDEGDDPPTGAASEPPAPVPPVLADSRKASVDGTVKAAVAPPKPAPRSVAGPPAPATMLKTVSDSLAAKHEKLTYRISMHGLPIGGAELEADNDHGVTSITLRVKSNAAVSSIFPVDNLVQTQQIDGRYILARIRQREGSYQRDEEFTINLRKKRVFWFDYNHSIPVTTNVPTDDVLDTLSGIYYLRNRQLQVGRTETLHIYDSETYADVPVEVLRREEIRLPNLKKVSTLVIRPLQRTAGIFRRTGDLLIWMTDDRYKVPVRIETSIALGRVTAELISAETTVQATPGPQPSTR